MLFGIFVQTVVLIIITYKTDWDNQVIDLLWFYDCAIHIQFLGEATIKLQMNFTGCGCSKSC